MSEGLSRGSFVKVAGFCDFYEHPLTERSDPTLKAAGVGWFFNPPRLPHGECGFGRSPRSLFALRSDEIVLGHTCLTHPEHRCRRHSPLVLFDQIKDLVNVQVAPWGK